MKSLYKIESHPRQIPGRWFPEKTTVLTILTPWLIRMEYKEDGTFEDRATQCVLNRAFPVPAFQVFEKEDSLSILTEGLLLQYDKKPFSPQRPFRGGARNPQQLELRGGAG